MKKYIVLTLIFSSLSASSNPKNILANANIATPLINEWVTISPAKNHHFNLEAPQKCTKTNDKISATKKANARLITCQFHHAGEFTATVSVCDDAKKYCKQENLVVSVTNQKSNQQKLIPSKETQAVQKKLKSTLLPNFKSLSPQQAKNQLTSDHQGILVVVSAEWCPPCNQNKEFLFPQKEVHKATEKFLKIYIDGDTPLLNSWKTKFDLKFYPSFFFFNKKLELIDFRTDAANSAEFLSWVNDFNENKDQPMAEVAERIKSRAADSSWQKVKDFFDDTSEKNDLEKMVRWAFQNNDHENVLKLTQQKKDFSYYNRWAQYQALLAKNIDELSEVQQKQHYDHLRVTADEILSNPNSLYKEYLDIYRQNCNDSKNGNIPKNKCQSYLRTYQQFLKKNHNEGISSLTVMDRAIGIANLNLAHLQVANLFTTTPSNIKKLRKNCFDSFELIKSFSPLKEKSRTLRVNQLSCLESENIQNTSLGLLKDLVKDYPFEEMFHRKYTSALMKKKRYKQALTSADLAIKYSYGRLYFHNIFKKVEVLKKLGDKKGAKTHLNKALQEIALSKEDKNLQRIVTKLRSAMKEI